MAEDSIAAHKHCWHNRSELQKSRVCGCFYCMSIFLPSEIDEWTDDGQSALCPKCGIDSVIGSESGYPTKEFLQRTNDHWFSTRVTQ
jgi:hypothetical protein